MVEVQTRRLTTAEHVRLQQVAGRGIRPDPAQQWLTSLIVGPLAGFGVAAALSTVPLFINGELVETHTGWFAAWDLLGALIGIPLFRMQLKRRAAIEAAEGLEGMAARVIRAEIGDSAAMDAIDETGPTWFFDVGDDRLLILQGPYLWALESHPLFPARSFEVVW